MVEEYHVDGFASTSRRRSGARRSTSTRSPFFEAVHQDPALSQVKLIAEPWDLGRARPGRPFPAAGRSGTASTATVRDFWRGLGASARWRRGSRRRLYAPAAAVRRSINFVTAHDGFTLRDLVAYNEKHNEANGEEATGRQRRQPNWNCGVEGPTDDPAIRALRARQQRNFLATLLLSQGVPMLLGGDEIGRTQHGNNNA